MDIVRQFMGHIAQFHSIETSYLQRHGHLLGVHYTLMHNERSLMWELQNIYAVELLDVVVWIPAMELPPEYNERDSLEQLRGLYILARAAAADLIGHPILNTLAKILFTRYDSAAWFLDGWLQHHLKS